MRGVENEDGSLAALGREGPSSHLEKAQASGLESNARFKTLVAARHLSPIGNTVKKFLMAEISYGLFLMADLVVYRAPLIF